MSAARPESLPADAGVPLPPIDNRERRTLCAIVVDAATLTPGELAELREDLAALCRDTAADVRLAVRLEFAVTTGRPRSDAEPVALLPPSQLDTTSLATPGGDLRRALTQAHEALLRRQQECRRLGIDVGSQWLWVLSGTSPGDRHGDRFSVPPSDWRAQLDGARHPTEHEGAWLRRDGRWNLSQRLRTSLGTAAAGGTWLPHAAESDHRGRTGSTVHLRGGDRPAQVGELLHRGRDASVYGLADAPGRVVRLFHHPHRIGWARIERLLATPFVAPPGAGWRVAWPLDTALDNAGARVGFVMQRVEGPQLLELCTPRLRATAAPGCTRHDLVVIATHLAELLTALHARDDLVLGYLGETDLRCSANGELWLTGIDHARIATPAGKPIPCSRWHLDLLPLPPTGEPQAPAHRDDDVHALAVLIHMLLLDGAHPFDAVVRDETLPLRRLDRQRRRLLPDSTPGLELPPGCPVQALPSRLRELFGRTFTGEGATAPSAADYAAALRHHLRSLGGADRCPRPLGPASSEA